MRPVPRPPSTPTRRAPTPHGPTPTQALRWRIDHQCPRGMDRTMYEARLLSRFGVEDQALLTHRAVACPALTLACVRGHVRLGPEAEIVSLTEEGKERLLGVNCLPLGKTVPRYSGNWVWRYDPYYPRAVARNAGLSGPLWRGDPPTPQITIATDASVSRDSTQAGIAAVASDGRWITLAYQTRPDMGVHMAEFRAILLAMSLPVTGQDVLILSDSLSAAAAFNDATAGHIPREMEELKVGATMQTLRAGLRLNHLPQLLKTFPHTRVEHVRAHSGHPLNEAADALARMARHAFRDKSNKGPGPDGIPLLQRAQTLVEVAQWGWAQYQAQGS